METDDVWLDANPSWSLFEAKRIHYWSTHTMLPRSQQEGHSLYRCVRWCLFQEHDGTEFPIAFLVHTFLETQRKWSSTEQEAYGVYYAITKWDYYLQGTNIIVWNDHKPCNKFFNGKNANNKVNRWGLELATYNITFEWISGAHNKAADCLSWLVELPQDKQISINVLSVTDTDGPTFTTRNQTHACLSTHTSTSQPDVIPDVLKQKMPLQNHWQQIGYKLSYRCRKLTFLQRNIQETIKWESTATWNWSLHACKRLTVQTHNRFWSEIPSSGHTQVLEVYCIG